MPITVFCPACGSRFSLSDDLYRRRVAGSLVKVKCRTCNAEIAVDATEPATMPSHEAPRRQHPHPPRPRAVTQIGLGTPPPSAGLATASPLPVDLTPTLPLSATVTPVPDDAPTPALATAMDPDSLWNDEEATIAINLAKTKSPPKPPPARAAHVDEPEEEVEQVEAEEIPVSSSGAPTLDALTMEAGGAHVPHGRPPPDEFLVSFGASADSALSAPTIDVTSFASEVHSPSVDAAQGVEVTTQDEQQLDHRPAHATVAQFDMNAAPPTVTSSASNGNAPSPPVPPRKPTDDSSIAPDAGQRERKFVIAPQAEVTSRVKPAARPSERRSRAPLWVGLLAAAGAVGAGIGYRERVSESTASEGSIASEARPVPSPVVNTQSALPAEAATAEALPAPPTASAVTAEAPVAPPVPVAPVAQTVSVGTTRNLAPSTTAAVKSSSGATGTAAQNPSTTAAPAAEKAVEAHNAPPPAAPDTEFDRDAARNALTSAAAQASSCRKEGDPSGTANLTITFAPSGRVTSAQIQGPPFSGTATGGCIASTMRRASVPSFSGDYVTVSKTIVVQ